jgi:hypothetical protein
MCRLRLLELRLLGRYKEYCGLQRQVARGEDRDALSDGLVGVARHHTAQAHLLVAASREIFKGGADGLATTYSPECVEGEFSEVQRLS